MFSPLQQYILGECFMRRDKIDRDLFERFYDNHSNVKSGARTKIVTKSLERLIDRGLMVGYGVRTPQKWFIKEIKITRFGIKEWEKFLERNQKRLPI